MKHTETTFPIHTYVASCHGILAVVLIRQSDLFEVQTEDYPMAVFN